MRLANVIDKRMLGIVAPHVSKGTMIYESAPAWRCSMGFRFRLRIRRCR